MSADRELAPGGNEPERPRSSATRMLVALAVRGFVYYGVIAVVVHLFANSLMFPAPESSYAASDRDIAVPLEGGGSVTAHLHGSPEAEWVVLFSHGNAEDLGHLSDFATDLAAALEVRVLAYDYPGYGTSEGSPGAGSAKASIRAVHRYATETLGVPPERLILHGRSIGGGPTLDLAPEIDCAGIILESTFVSAFRVMTRIPLFPFDPFPNLARIDEIDAPILICHGERDSIVHSWHGRRLHEAVPETVDSTLWISPRAGHNNLSYDPNYLRTLKTFVDALRSR